MGRSATLFMSISEMKEFASFPAAAQRYIRRSLDVAEGRDDVFKVWARSDDEARSICAQDDVYRCIPGLKSIIPEDASLGAVETYMGTAVAMASFDLRGGKLTSFGAFRFLYERLLGAAARPWLPSTFLAAASLPSIQPELRKTMLQSVSEAAATAPGWSAKEPVFFPRWVEKVGESA